MKQVLLLAAIYSLVLYQSQKNAKDKIAPASTITKGFFGGSIRTAQRPIAKAASLPLKLYQQYLQLRHNYGNTSKKVVSDGSPNDFVFVRWD